MSCCKSCLIARNLIDNPTPEESADPRLSQQIEYWQERCMTPVACKEVVPDSYSDIGMM
jgi:hypothetical protein